MKSLIGRWAYALGAKRSRLDDGLNEFSTPDQVPMSGTNSSFDPPRKFRD